MRESIKWSSVAGIVLGLHVTVFAFTIKETEQVDELQASDTIAGGCISIDIFQDLEQSGMQCSEPPEPLIHEEQVAEPRAETAEPFTEVNKLAQAPTEQEIAENFQPLQQDALPPEKHHSSVKPQPDLEMLAHVKYQQEQVLAEQKQRQAEQELVLEKQRKLATARAKKLALAKKIVCQATPGNNNRSNPQYPRTLRRRGIEGSVVLHVRVNAKGKVGSLKVKQSSGHNSFDQSALRAVKNWIYNPAKNGLGTTVASTKVETIVYRLR